MNEISTNFELDQFSLTREGYRLWKMEWILRITPIVIHREFFDPNGIIRILLKVRFNGPNS